MGTPAKRSLSASSCRACRRHLRALCDYFFLVRRAVFRRVAAAFFAACFRVPAFRRRAALRAWRDRALREAELRGSRCRALTRARDRRGDGLRPSLAAARSCRAFLRAAAEARPFVGGGSFTPARRAFERPIAIAWRADRAPCFPRRISSISSRTNSPACVDADLPALASRRARRSVSALGMPARVDGAMAAGYRSMPGERSLLSASACTERERDPRSGRARKKAPAPVEKRARGNCLCQRRPTAACAA